MVNAGKASIKVIVKLHRNMNFLHEFSPTHEQTDAETDIQIYVSTINVFRNLISKNCAIVQLKKQTKKKHYNYKLLPII